MKRRVNDFTYKGLKSAQISFPLGGIGSGSIGLSGEGRLIDWEIFNRPNKGGLNGFSHFAIRAESNGKLLDARVLQGELSPPYTGAIGHDRYAGYGFGPRRETLAGMPHFRSASFKGFYPFANLRFKDSSFPGKVQILAFNPLIPINDKDSSIPAAFFEFSVRNPTADTVTYTFAGILGNPFTGEPFNIFRRFDGISALHVSTRGLDCDDTQYGDLTLATDAGVTSHQEYWFRGRWFDALEVYWRDLTTPGRFENRRYDNPERGDHGVLAAHVRVPPGRVRKVRFAISWNVPVCENYWNREKAARLAGEAGIPTRWRNYYATVWKDSLASARYAFSHWKRLITSTERFKNALFRSCLPDVVLDAVSSNLSILKTPTVLRLEDGTLYGFEGSHCDSGCCPGSCTHVWNYAQAHAFLFPALARSMRAADYRHNQQSDGGMPFRIELPLGVKNPGGFSCADGLFGNVMLVYRDWKISGDSGWLRSMWPFVKKSIRYAWSPGNPHRWDPGRTGVLWGRQHHTLDMELFGPSSWLCGFYLGALKAAARMAQYLGDKEAAEDYQALFMKGKQWVEGNLFNGEYYHQLISVKDRSLVQSHDAEEVYWDSEHGEIKYQIDQGCAIDQTLAQYHADLYGLGDIFDRRKTRTALKSLFRYNYVKRMRNVYNPCRLYSLNDEGGMTICTWPEGRRKPAIPLTYAQETMNGFEYAAAVQMIQNGLVKEGLKIVKSVRDRYDGQRRNPWNEFECGSNYARSMSSYALLNAFSGFEFDMSNGHIGFRPVCMPAGRFRCFWSLASGWGEIDIRKQGATLSVLYGHLKLRSIALNLPGRVSDVAVKLGRRNIPAKLDNGTIRFAPTVTIRERRELRISLPG